MGILRLSFDDISEDDLVKHAVEFLRRVKVLPVVLHDPWKLGPWETCAQFCRRALVPARTFRRRMEDRQFMPPIQIKEGPSGRILQLRAHEAFERWLKGPER